MASYQKFQVSRNKNSKRDDVLNSGKLINKKAENLTKSERLMNGIALWASFYRANPHRFAEEYLGLNLKLFQKILLFMMNYSNYFIYLAARGM